MKTQVFSIDLSEETDIAGTISKFCDAKLNEGLGLVSTFTYKHYLVLVFQPMNA